MEEKDVRSKLFFDELYLSSNPSSKIENSRALAKKRLLFVCYFLCGFRNKFINDLLEFNTLHTNQIHFVIVMHLTVLFIY